MNNNINNKVLELTEMLSEAASTGIFPGGNFALVCEEKMGTIL